MKLSTFGSTSARWAPPGIVKRSAFCPGRSVAGTTVGCLAPTKFQGVSLNIPSPWPVMFAAQIAFGAAAAGGGSGAAVVSGAARTESPPRPGSPTCAAGVCGAVVAGAAGAVAGDPAAVVDEVVSHRRSTAGLTAPGPPSMTIRACTWVVTEGSTVRTPSRVGIHRLQAPVGRTPRTSTRADVPGGRSAVRSAVIAFAGAAGRRGASTMTPSERRRSVDGATRRTAPSARRTLTSSPPETPSSAPQLSPLGTAVAVAASPTTAASSTPAPAISTARRRRRARRGSGAAAGRAPSPACGDSGRAASGS